MSTLVSSRLEAVAPSLSAPASTSLTAAFGAQLADLAGLVRRSSHLYTSPIAPLALAHPQQALPRFVYFGPDTNEVSPRLAFYAGHDHRDLRGTHALLHFVHRLALQPDIGHGLYLSFFPLVDVLGLAGRAASRPLASASWVGPAEPELNLLAHDARSKGYHGFVRLETVSGDDTIVVRLRSLTSRFHETPQVDLLSSIDVAPFQVRWEAEARESLPDGPLSLADVLPFPAFELVLGLPAAWNAELHREATASILKRVVLRYRSFLAHAQHI